MNSVFLQVVAMIMFFSFMQPISVNAEPRSPSESGKIKFNGEYPKGVVDPEHPDKEVNPGPSPTTEGSLRFDFVPQLNFWSNVISEKDQVYYANAQLFLDGTGARGNFVQLSDYREKGSGWSLQVRQETQLTNESAQNKELKGSVISLDQSWTNSINSASYAPNVSKEVIHINNIGETYDLAQAKPGTGEGTWSIIFGASIDNGQGRKDTLSPRIDQHGQPFLDPGFNNQPIYQNNAVSLSIPGKTKKDPVHYQTMLTWILSELP
ncbi:WxL domain-containing protein [Enterococcus sp. DIV0212c]|uniref:WxL domain-containing protein n=1 Tax=Enterococcus sp. DIV0212c TaxID=2230867 RepID=UPI0035C83A33